MILRALSSLPSLLIFTVIFAAARVVLAVQRLYLPGDADILWSLYARLFIAGWIYFDRRGRGLVLPFEFEAFVFFAWPLFLPYYLHKSRGAWRGIAVTAVTFFVLLLVPAIAQVIVRVI